MVENRQPAEPIIDFSWIGFPEGVVSCPDTLDRMAARQVVQRFADSRVVEQERCSGTGRHNTLSSVNGGTNRWTSTLSYLRFERVKRQTKRSLRLRRSVLNEGVWVLCG